MKTFLTTVILCLCLELSAQTNRISEDVSVGEYSIERNDAENPCITAEQYKIIEDRCKENALLYIHKSPQERSNASILLNWPLQKASSLDDCSYYYISAHVDQNPAAAAFTDYNCGTISYDGHKGTDIAIGPFPFYKMDNNQVEVIAAAAGTIIDKHDGEFDKNCAGVSPSAVANYIVVQHSDSSRALYFHMKKNSLTSKSIGQSVATGEFLGIVGSSGNSSGPHLHFEVWAGSTTATYNDPFSGTCNLLNASSWWNIQKPYTEPEILKASVHTTDVTAPACPATETINESNTYIIPFQGPGLPAGYAKFYIFMRNETSGTTVDMKILNPNGTVFTSWTRNCTTNYKFSYWGYSKSLPASAGTYTFEATYNGITCSQDFEIVVPTEINEGARSAESISVYPNPVNAFVTIWIPENMKDGELVIFNSIGQNVKSINYLSGREIKFDREDLRAGMYFIRVISENNVSSTGKFVIEN